MTIKDKLLSGGYTPAETFVCQEGYKFLDSVYNAINNTQLRAYEVLYDYFLPREKDSVTRLMKFEKIWANKITHPILVPKTFFTGHIFITQINEFKFDDFLSKNFGFVNYTFNKNSAAYKHNIYRMDINFDKIYRIMLMEIAIYYYKYGVLRDYEMKILIFEVIVRYFKFYRQVYSYDVLQDIYEYTFNTELIDAIYNKLLNTDIKMVLYYMSTYLGIKEIEFLTEDNYKSIREHELNKKEKAISNRGVTYENIVKKLVPHFKKLDTLSSVYEMIQAEYKLASYGYARKFANRYNINKNTYKQFIEDVSKLTPKEIDIKVDAQLLNLK